MKMKRPFLTLCLWRSVALLAAGMLALSSAANAATWIITNYGDDPDDASTLRGALHVAQDGDTIDRPGLTGAIVLTHGGNVQVLNMLGMNASVTISVRRARSVV